MNRFEEIYRRAAWASGTGVLSGSGSTKKSCAAFAEWIESIAGRCSKILDLGCGDLEWIAEIPAIRERRIAYHGIDIVHPLIAHHRRVFPWFAGECCPITQVPDARGADVILLKDVLFHLSTEEATAILQMIAGWPGWRRLAVTSHRGVDNCKRRVLSGPAMAAFDVEALNLPLLVERRIRRPDGGEVIILSRPA